MTPFFDQVFKLSVMVLKVLNLEIWQFPSSTTREALSERALDLLMRY